MKDINYSPFANHHPGWLRFVFGLIFLGSFFLISSLSLGYIKHAAGYLGIPIGFVSAYYISYYGLYGLYEKFSNTSNDVLFEKLEKIEHEKKQMKEAYRLLEMSKKIREEKTKR
jgi:hypothetical protein